MQRKLQSKLLLHQNKLHKAQPRLQGQIRKRKQHQDKPAWRLMLRRLQSKLQQRTLKLKQLRCRQA